MPSVFTCYSIPRGSVHVQKALGLDSVLVPLREGSGTEQADRRYVPILWCTSHGAFVGDRQDDRSDKSRHRHLLSKELCPRYGDPTSKCTPFIQTSAQFSLKHCRVLHDSALVRETTCAPPNARSVFIGRQLFVSCRNPRPRASVDFFRGAMCEWDRGKAASTQTTTSVCAP